MARRCSWCHLPPPNEGDGGKCGQCGNVFYCSRAHQVLDWKKHNCTAVAAATTMHVDTALIGWPMHLSTQEEKKGFALFKRLRVDHLPAGDLVNDDAKIVDNVWNALTPKQKLAWKKKAATDSGMSVSDVIDTQAYVYFIRERMNSFIKVDREYYLKKPEDLKDRSAAAQIWRNLIKSERMEYIKMARDNDEEAKEEEKEDKMEVEKKASSSASLSPPSSPTAAVAASSSVPVLSTTEEPRQDLKRELEETPLTDEEKRHLGYLEFIHVEGAPYKLRPPIASLTSIHDDIFKVIPKEMRVRQENKAIRDFGEGQEYEAILMRVNKLEHYIRNKDAPHPTRAEDASQFEDNSHAARMWQYMIGMEADHFIDRALANLKNKRAKTTTSFGLPAIMSVLTEKDKRHLGYLEFIRVEGAPYKLRAPIASFTSIHDDIFKVIPKGMKERQEKKAVRDFGEGQEYEAILMRVNMLEHYIRNKDAPHPTRAEDASQFEDNSHAARMWQYMIGEEQQFFIDRALTNVGEIAQPVPVAVVPPAPVAAVVPMLTSEEMMHFGYRQFLRDTNAHLKGMPDGDKACFFFFHVVRDLFELLPESLLRKLYAKSQPGVGSLREAAKVRRIMLLDNEVEYYILPHPFKTSDAARFEDPSYAARLWAYMTPEEQKHFITKALAAHYQSTFPLHPSFNPTGNVD